MRRFNAEQISANMKAIRKGKGLTQTDVAKVLGITKQAVCYMEKHPEHTTINRLNVLADLYGVSTRAFFDEKVCN